MDEILSATVYRKEKAFLMEMACRTLNTTPPLRSRIRERDEVLSMEKEERIRMDVYRKATNSCETRAKRLDEATTMFLKDMMGFNKKVEEERKKTDRALESYKTNVQSNLKHARRIDIIQAVVLKLNLFQTVMETKVKLHKEFVVTFLEKVADDMSLPNPSMVFNRHTTLCFIHQELHNEHDEKASTLNHLRAKKAAYVNEMNHKILVGNTEVITLEDRLKRIKNEVTHREAHLTYAMSNSTTTAMVLYHVTSAIFSIFKNFLNNRREIDEVATDPMAALDLIQVTIDNVTYAAKKLHRIDKRTAKDLTHKANDEQKPDARRVRKSYKTERSKGTPGGEKVSEPKVTSHTLPSHRPNTQTVSLPLIGKNKSANAVTAIFRNNSKTSWMKISRQRSKPVHCTLPDLTINVTGGL